MLSLADIEWQVVDTRHGATARSEVVEVHSIGAPGTDVAACKSWNERLLAVSTVGIGGKQNPGRVLLYTVGTDGKLQILREYLTDDGRLPDQITWTKDCKTIIAAIEGEAVPLINTNSLGRMFVGLQSRVVVAVLY